MLLLLMLLSLPYIFAEWINGAENQATRDSGLAAMPLVRQSYLEIEHSLKSRVINAPFDVLTTTNVQTNCRFFSMNISQRILDLQLDAYYYSILLCLRWLLFLFLIFNYLNTPLRNAVE